jgi:PAS domain S-box-containing protein
VLGIFYALVFSLGKLDELNPAALVALILVATFVFQPIRNWLQEVLDRHYFYRDRYDYRRTLEEFARELGTETDLDRMLDSAADRLQRTLSIQKVEFFLVDDETGQFRPRKPAAERLDLSFLQDNNGKEYLFFEQTRHALDVFSRHWPPSVRQTIADLDFTYYIACKVRGRTIAYIGVSRTNEGDFLTSGDLELLVTLSGSIGIAIENARLYRTLQRKVEQYERLKEFSENIVESINVGILAADLEDRVESWNSQIEKLTGITRQQAMGQRLAELFPGDLCERFEKVRGETGIHHVYKFTLKLNGRNGHSNGAENGHPREAILNLAIAPLVSKDSQQIGRLIIFDDITDRAELERRLVQADKLSSIGLLAAGVAHEVNTPLAVISTYAQMLAKQISGDEQKSKLLEKIAKQTFRASEIVNSLLNFSRTSAHEFDEVDLNKVIRETLSLVEHQLEKARVQVKLCLENDLPTVRGNGGKLQQVFLNLVLNARDAMESGGILAVKTWSDDGHARIEVADTGHGIPADHLPRIFDPFFTTKQGRKGTGLGLSVTYGIVQEHGGAIDVQSEPGAGTRFNLDFPLARTAVHA